ncbi:NVEALA domain-containing protein [uncultured Proteiniphilum sp.]|uniref:NVEALA domain-containing protein n=1 Tax=uncultured Proteiniphilum sp. TaxID=497637 RepID=UPI0026080668|nr:NVEALA domain-containing protein [uncultured Proteiniphilum sp.]
MKKKLLSGIFSLALLATAGYGVNKSMKSDANLSDLVLANVEALAQSEDDIDDMIALCDYLDGHYCNYFVVTPSGGVGWSHWNMINKY